MNNDMWDYDGVNVVVFVDIKYKGKDYDVIIYVDCNGFFYVIDCMIGKLIYVMLFVKVLLVIGYMEDGKLI